MKYRAIPALEAVKKVMPKTNRENDRMRFAAKRKSRVGVQVFLNQKSVSYFLGACGFFSVLGLSSCLTTSIEKPSTATPSPTPSPTYSVPSGAKAAKIIFKNTSGGSFNSPAAGGTAPAPASGLQAVRVFDADGTQHTTWPEWLTSVEIGITGTAANSSDANCARFADATDPTTTCDFDDDAATPEVSCGAAQYLFRVSDYDCAQTASATEGTGGPSDTVYIRASFNRDTSKLGESENILAVLEYASSALNSAPANPTTCFSGGEFNPTTPGCADSVWYAFLKHNAYEISNRFLMITPPAFAYVSATDNRGGGGVSTKQIVLPLARDSTLSVFQMSRIKGLASGNFGSKCGTNSALCVGTVFYSLTFYRI
ncbi:MAG: hypothetical protein A3K03_04780 [Bdellovibrionales bacterium RIFOXYD1_FULL_44_7]|nr:MAG: hypothetical protein A3K03_04780 [Bdellovibrionales bacterium RIFOXYD1_FULL_44_7]